MNGSRFDDISRRIAKAGERVSSRRNLLKGGVGVGVAAAVGAPDLYLCAAAPSTGVPTARAVARQASPDDILIQQIAFDLDYDPDSIFRFVADEIAYESYDGALRGPRGTIWSGAGNSVDQSQLLATLLAEALVDVRYAVGPLDDRGAATLLEAMAAPRSSSEVLTRARQVNREAEATARRPTAASTPAADPSDRDGLMARVTALRDDLFTGAAAALADDVGMLTRLLSDAGVDLPAPVPALTHLERTRHVWLQVRRGAEWIDLDPSFPGRPTAGIDPASVETTAELPAELFHALRFRVIAETLSGESVVEQVMLDQTARSQDLVGADLLIMHVEPESLEAIGVGIAEVLGGELAYYPLLVIGEEGYLADAKISLGSSGGVLSGDVLGGAGGLVDGECLAERYEVTVASPDAGNVVVARSIFDRIPAEQRATGRIVPGEIPRLEEIDFGNGERAVVEVKRVVALAAVVSAVDRDYLDRPVSAEAPISAYTSAVHAMYAFRESLQETGPGAPALYPDRPSLTAYTTSPVPGPDGTNAGLRVDADLLHDGYRWRSAGDQAAPALYAGVLAQKAERLALDRTLLDLLAEAGFLPSRPQLAASDIQDVFAAARDQRVDVVALIPAAGPAALDALDLGTEVRRRLAALLEAGKVVVTPAKSVVIDGSKVTAWWVVDPETGQAVDELIDGRSGASIVFGPMGEYALKLWTFARTLKGFLLLGACIGALMQAIGSMMNFNKNSTAGDLISFTGADAAAGAACAAFVAGGPP